MGAMLGNLDQTAELEAPSVGAGRFTDLGESRVHS